MKTWLWVGLGGGALVCSAGVACSAGGSNTSSSLSSSSTANGGAGSGGGGGLLAVGGAGGVISVGNLEGQVLAPEGTIPISGALVYLTPAPPDGIPDGVYCDRCVELDSGTPYTESAADGSFNLPAYQTGEQYLVVQKGQFRRYRTVDVVEGAQSVPAAMTTLPGKMDKANGDDIPKMAVLVGAWDDIGDSLQKLGMQPGSFDRFIGSFPPNANDPFAPNKLVHDPAVMNQYHIVFMPCDSSDGVMCEYSYAQDSATRSTLQQYAEAGGKVYVTDYSYDYIREAWPGYIDWVGQDSSFGSACMSNEYDAPAQVEDQGMQDWLTAQNITSFSLEANWTMVDKVNTLASTDSDGNPADITPKVWVSGQTPSNGLKPATVSFERGCGRVLFSTYHTEGTGGGSLLAQEKALLYVLLEVGVCIGVPVPK